MKKLIPAMLFVFVLACQISFAFPPLPGEFYGLITADGATSAAVGTYVEIRAASGAICGSIFVEVTGYYGVVSCRGDDLRTSEIEGAQENEALEFYVNGIKASYLQGAKVWKSAKYAQTDVNPKPSQITAFCGDGTCNGGETCRSCTQDCGECQKAINATAAIQEIASETSANNRKVCREDWTCSGWTVCAPNGVRTRSCSDKKKCGTRLDKPTEVEFCEYIPTCSDGMENGDEEGLDCGGTCKPCETCEDGIQNQDEEGLDCGGICAPCKKEGSEIIAEPEKPALVAPLCGDGVCEIDEICAKDCRKFQLAKTAASLAAILFVVSALHIYANKSRSKGRLRKLIKMNMLFIYVFSAAAAALVIFVAVYRYFFCFSGGDCLANVWIVIDIAAVVFVMVYIFFRTHRYNEGNRRSKEIRLLISQESLLKNLISHQEDIIIEETKAVRGKLGMLAKGNELLPIVQALPQIGNIYEFFRKNGNSARLPDVIYQGISANVLKLADNKNLKKFMNMAAFSDFWDSINMLTYHVEERAKLATELKKVEKELLTQGIVTK